MKTKGIGIGIVIGLTIGSVAVGGYVVARPAANSKKLAACVDRDGTMRLKAPATASCPKGQKKVTWNAQGPRGPQGTHGADGVDGAPGNDGAPGQDGVDGAPGQDGVDGAPGQDGVDGAPGDKGDKGDTGDAVLESVNCLSGQTIVWTGTDWGCRTIAITGQLSISSVAPIMCCVVIEVFDSYTPNVLNYPCDEVFCLFALSDVSDHQSCTVTVYGNPTASAVSVVKNEIFIELELLDQLTEGEPFYVNLSCLQ